MSGEVAINMTSTSQVDLQEDVQYFEYTKAANPVAAGVIAPVPFAELLSDLHEHGPTRVIPFDLGEKLGSNGPSTSPNLSVRLSFALSREPGSQHSLTQLRRSFT